MVELAILANLAAFSLIASQPLFYLLALTRASHALPAAAYVELRNRLNDVMKKRVPVFYVSALATCLWLLAAGFAAGDALLATTTLIALVGLGLDVLLMLRGSVPVNETIASWQGLDPPADWESYRARWSSVLVWRQIALASSFLSLLIGAAFH